MKKSYLVLLVGYMLSCNRGPNHALLEFIPGTYVRTIQHEFAVGKDTLFINYKVEKWTGVFEVRTGLIQVLGSGKIISFAPKENKLFLGETEYQKVR